MLRILVHLVIGDDHHDSEEYAEAGGASLGRHRKRDRKQRKQQHHRHLHDPEVEVGAAPVPLPLARVRGVPVPDELGNGELLIAVAAPSEGVDGGDRDRNIVVLEGQHSRHGETGGIVNQAALGKAKDDRVGIVGGEKRAQIRSGSQSLAVLGLGAKEHAMKVPPFIVAAVHAERHPLAQLVELPDLDRGAQSARTELKAKPFVGVAGIRLKEADNGQIDGHQGDRVHVGHSKQAPVAEAHGAQSVQLRGQSELSEREQYAEHQSDRDPQREIFGDQIGQHLPHHVDRTAQRDDEVEQAQHLVEQEQHCGQHQGRRQRNEDQPGQIAVDAAADAQLLDAP
jgi:hypothetical protein